ncbi:unnamed protein product [Ambrosiozyma monospora]|uniref:Unnamed protein product n=1 Tax=Ambrosiozyma monospora TaxID=43982 RepID=A0ACB5T174_AMBMO|nr:unnamed protein product [Ambrosiozyma monospora]
MLPNIESSVKQLSLIPELLSDIDYTFYKIIGTIQPVYALSSIISLFAHDLNKFDDLCLIWDFVFVHNDPSLFIYIYATLLIYYRDDILTDLDEISGKSFSSDDTLTNSGLEFDDSYVGEFYNSDLIHVTLTNLIKNNLNTTNSIDSNLEIYNILQMSVKNKDEYPLDSLKSVQKLSKYSSLRNKTISLTTLDLQIEEQRQEMKKLKEAQEKEYQKRVEERRVKEQLRKQEEEKQFRKKQLVLRFQNLSMILKVSIGIGIFGIVVNYALNNTQYGHSIRNRLVGLCTNHLYSVSDSNGESNNIFKSALQTIFGKHTPSSVVSHSHVA